MVEAGLIIASDLIMVWRDAHGSHHASEGSRVELREEETYTPQQTPRSICLIYSASETSSDSYYTQ